MIDADSIIFSPASWLVACLFTETIVKSPCPIFKKAVLVIHVEMPQLLTIKQRPREMKRFNQGHLVHAEMWQLKAGASVLTANECSFLNTSQPGHGGPERPPLLLQLQHLIVARYFLVAH